MPISLGTPNKKVSEAHTEGGLHQLLLSLGDSSGTIVLPHAKQKWQTCFNYHQLQCINMTLLNEVFLKLLIFLEL